METVIIKSNRKSLSLSIDDNLNVVVRAPYYADEQKINSFVNSNTDWINSAVLRKKASLEKLSHFDNNKEHYIKLAKEIIPKRVEYYSSIMNLYPTGIRITCAKKRFGSCNSKNSLCFSAQLMMYSMEAVDYVVVHELAHIKHHNHSKEFYNLISSYMPDYKNREKQLRNK